MAVALLKKLDLKMWKGPRPIQVKKKKKSWALWFKKKIIAHIQVIYSLFSLTLEYLMKSISALNKRKF